MQPSRKRTAQPAQPSVTLRRLAAACSLVLAFTLASLPAAAAGATPAQPSHVAAAKELLRLLRVEDSVAPMVGQLSLLLTEQIQQWEPPEDQAAEVEKTIAKVNAALNEEINWQNLETDYVVLYTETFTEAELKEISRFFRSGAGAKYIASVPGIQQRTMNIGELRMARVQPRLELLLGDLKRHLDVLELERNPPATVTAPRDSVTTE
jgi:hypothetical protein